MSTGDRASVFRTTKVRTKLKGDLSWMQQGADNAQAGVSEEKPWMAEVRANRLSSAQEASPELSSAPAPAPAPAPVNTPKLEKTPGSGYLIRGVFTKTDSKPTSSTTTNGFRSSPTVVRPSPELQRASPSMPSEGQLSPEEHNKRTEAASSVLKRSSVRQRSYVLSAAKKFESVDREPDTLLNGSPSFVAKRVETTDEEESTPPSATIPTISPTPIPTPPLAPTPVPETTAPQTPANTSVKTVVVEQEVKVVPMAPSVSLETPAQEATTTVASVTEDDSLVLVTPVTVEEEEDEEEEEEVADNDPFKDMKPGCTKVDTPLPILILEPEKAEEVDEDPFKDMKPGCTKVYTPLPILILEPEKAEEVDEDPFKDMKPGCTKVATPLPILILEPEKAEEEDEDPFEVMKPGCTKVDTPLPILILEPEKAEEEDEDPFKVMKPGCTKVDTPLPILILQPEKAEEVDEDPFKDMKPGCTKVASPLPILILEPEKAEEEDEDPFKDMKPGCTKVATPLPMLILEPEKEEEEEEEEVEALPIPEGTVRDKLALWESAAPAPAPAAVEVTVKTEPVEEPWGNQTSFITETLPTSSTLVSFDTSSTSLLDSQIQENEPAPTGPVAGSYEEEPVPELSNCIVMTDELLALTGGPEELVPVEPVPPSPGRWSQDLLGGPEGPSGPVSTSLDLLAGDVIPINTEAHSLSTDTKEESNGWYQTSTDMLSPTETFTTRTIDISSEPESNSWGPQVTTPTTTAITSSSTDPFDPYPIGTASPNSSCDPAPPLPARSINSSEDLMSSTSPAEGDLSSGFSEHTNALEALADDVIPIDTDTKSLSSHHSWARTWETDTSTEERPEDVSSSQQTMVMFERKSLENDSPWDRWTSPTVFTVPTEEDEEPEESPGETETQTVTTVPTIRETYSDPEPAMDRSETHYSTVTSEESQRTQTPEPKKPFVYVKEYVNATELSSHNAMADFGSGSEYLTTSSTDYSYSSPTTYSRREEVSSICNYCEKPVGNDAKITIEHLNINCHPDCFKCGVCSRPMGDLIYGMYLHGGTVHCESCYSKTLD